MTQIITVEIGSRGLANPTGFEKLANDFNIKDSDLKCLLTNLSQEAILGSHSIQCCNKQNKLIYMQVPIPFN